MNSRNGNFVYNSGLLQNIVESVKQYLTDFSDEQLNTLADVTTFELMDREALTKVDDLSKMVDDNQKNGLYD